MKHTTQEPLHFLSPNHTCAYTCSCYSGKNTPSPVPGESYHGSLHPFCLLLFLRVSSVNHQHQKAWQGAEASVHTGKIRISRFASKNHAFNFPRECLFSLMYDNDWPPASSETYSIYLPSSLGLRHLLPIFKFVYSHQPWLSALHPDRLFFLFCFTGKIFLLHFLSTLSTLTFSFQSTALTVTTTPSTWTTMKITNHFTAASGGTFLTLSSLTCWQHLTQVASFLDFLDAMQAAPSLSQLTPVLCPTLVSRYSTAISILLFKLPSSFASVLL